MKLSCLRELTIAVRLLLAGATLFGYSQAGADEEAASDTLQLEPISVTGTHISSSELETGTPLTLIDRTDVDRMGSTGLGELLQKLPMMSGSPTSSGRNFDDALGPSDGSSGRSARTRG